MLACRFPGPLIIEHSLGIPFAPPGGPGLWLLHPQVCSTQGKRKIQGTDHQGAPRSYQVCLVLCAFHEPCLSHVERLGKRKREMPVPVFNRRWFRHHSLITHTQGLCLPRGSLTMTPGRLPSGTGTCPVGGRPLPRVSFGDLEETLPGGFRCFTSGKTGNICTAGLIVRHCKSEIRNPARAKVCCTSHLTQTVFLSGRASLLPLPQSEGLLCDL